MNIITIHGLRFAVEGSGFVRAHAERDFEAIVDRIETALRDMDVARMAALHHGALVDAETGEFHVQSCADELHRLAHVEAAEVLKSWHNPAGAHVMISAQP